VILLFQGWVLDSEGSFAAGVIGIFLLGMLTEFLTWCRRNKISANPSLRQRPAAFKAAMGAAFTTQVTLGYFLMLAAMTYQGEIFIAVIAGLAAGHIVFNIEAPVGESVDACCVEASYQSDTATRRVRGLRSLRAPKRHPGSSSHARVAEQSPGVASQLTECVVDEQLPPEMRTTQLRIAPDTCSRCVDKATSALTVLPEVVRVTFSKVALGECNAADCRGEGEAAAAVAAVVWSPEGVGAEAYAEVGSAEAEVRFVERAATALHGVGQTVGTAA